MGETHIANGYTTPHIVREIPETMAVQKRNGQFCLMEIKKLYRKLFPTGMVRIERI